MITILLFLYIGVVSGYKEFQERVPNGANMSNPCIRGDKWPGLGHQYREGGGLRNPFGVAFGLNDKVNIRI